MCRIITVFNIARGTCAKCDAANKIKFRLGDYSQSVIIVADDSAKYRDADCVSRECTRVDRRESRLTRHDAGARQHYVRQEHYRLQVLQSARSSHFAAVPPGVLVRRVRRRAPCNSFLNVTDAFSSCDTRTHRLTSTTVFDL